VQSGAGGHGAKGRGPCSGYEQLGEDAHGEEVVSRGGDPSLGVERQAASGDDAMDVGVEAQVARPGVKDGGDAEVGAESARGAAELEEGGGGGGEEGVEHQAGIDEGEAAEGPREGEDDVEGVGGEHACHALLDPPGLGERLALWTVPVATGVVGWGLDMTAGGADVLVSAEGGRPASGDVAQDGRLLGREGVSAREVLPEGADDVGDLERRSSKRALPRGGVRSVEHGALAESPFGARGAEQIDGALDAGDMLGGDARVAEGGADMGVSEEHLDDADIGAELEEVSGEAVAQDVGSDTLLQTGLVGGLVQVVAHGVDADGAAGLLAGKQLGAAGPGGDPVAAEHEENALGQRHVPIAAAFRGVADVQEHALTVDIGDTKGAHLADAQSGAVRRHDDGAVHGLLEGLENAIDLGAAQDVGEGGANLGVRDRDGDLGSLEGGAVEEAEGGDGDLEGGVTDPVVDEPVHEKLLDLTLPHVLRAAVVILSKESRVAKVFGRGVLGETSNVQVLSHERENVIHGNAPFLRRQGPEKQDRRG